MMLKCAPRRKNGHWRYCLKCGGRDELELNLALEDDDCDVGLLIELWIVKVRTVLELDEVLVWKLEVGFRLDTFGKETYTDEDEDAK